MEHAAEGSPISVVSWWATWPAEAVLGTIVSERVHYFRQLARRYTPEEGQLTFPEELHTEIQPLIMPPSAVSYDDARGFMDVPAGEYEQVRRPVRRAWYSHWPTRRAPARPLFFTSNATKARDRRTHPTAPTSCSKEVPLASSWRIRVSLALNFVVFAILLNTVGIVIKRVIDDYGISEASAASLEAFKDLSIAGASFLLASYIPRFGYRRSMLLGLLGVSLASMLVALVTGFWVTPVLYMTIGVSFALMKGAVYSTVGLVTRDQQEHTSLMNILEGLFQVGALAGPLLFSFVLGLHYAWRQTYWLIAVVSAFAFLLLLTTDLDETEVATHLEEAGFVEMLKLLRLPTVWVFVLCAWLYVMIEQSFGTWLPTFHERIFGLSPAVAAALLSLYAGSIALSRFLMGYLSRHFPWMPIQLALLGGGFALTLGVLLLTPNQGSGVTVQSWREASPLAFVFSCMGFFIGPIYPTIVSIVLSRLEKARHPAMTGLIIVFSALGGTTGSLIVGFISRTFSTHNAFFYPLLPMTLLGALLIPYRRLTERAVEG